MSYNEQMKILRSAFEELKKTVGSKPVETGGVLLGYREDLVIRKFIFDEKARTTEYNVKFNWQYLWPLLKIAMVDQGMDILGCTHSHKHPYSELSSGDMTNISYLLNNCDDLLRGTYLAPIIFSSADGKFKIFPYALYKHSSIVCKKEKLIII